ncbi:hypothetical protein SD77_3548 [Bacillus badius]|uniref:Uncharacterized protein n=1 Tax=Bacillus badius TaxID=1455 RepID=A0ABR5AY33_BACBA|nr:hypothetical protein SD78_1318 [Bacillus badius]KIL79128.1 hypothetical protein SD77_3548 [Bacillus badius]
MCEGILTYYTTREGLLAKDFDEVLSERGRDCYCLGGLNAAADHLHFSR